MIENDFKDFDAITRFKAYQAQRRYRKLFLFFSWKLFCKKSVLRCIFAWEFEAFWIVQSRGTLTKLGALLNVCLLAWDIDVFWIIMWRVNSKQPGKIRYGILVKIYVFSWDNMAFLCGISLFPEKKALFFYPAEADFQRCSVQKVFQEISQNSQENTCARVSFLIKLQASGLSTFQKIILVCVA